MGLKVWFLAPLLYLAVAGESLSTVDFLYTATAQYETACADRFPNGAMIQKVSAGRTAPLIRAFAASADPAISFDGRRVLFAGKERSGDPWQIWEMPIIGGTPRRVTRFPDDAVAPFYAAGDRLVYARRSGGSFQVESALLGGTNPIPVTYGPGDHLPTAVLRDGRILFEAPHPGAGGRDLFTVYLDGSGVETYRCDHRHDRSGGVELSSGDILFNTGGRLARFTSPRAVEVDLPSAAGQFAGRADEAAPGEFLTAYRAGPGQSYAIYRWRPGQGAPEKVIGAPSGDAVDPLLIRPHDVPKRHPSALGDREGANLLCLNVYTSKSRIPRGSVAAVRVWTLDDGGAAVPLGQSPVETDGSFFVQAPADRGIRFELLNGGGKTIAEEKGWFWARRGEQRICVGCHAGPERAPENAVPKILLRGAEPAPLLLSRGGAHRGAK